MCFKYTVAEGLSGFRVSLKISSILGTPRVTLDLVATPAKWKVFNVSCVVGSPMDWPAITPTISPGSTIALLKL